MTKKIVFWLLFLFLIFLIAEIFVRLTGKEKTFSEKIGGSYTTYYGQHLPTWYHTWSPNKPVVYDQPEIKCSYPANSLGLREVEIPLARKDSTQRLFFIGDSFTEGDGVAYPYSMPRFIEKKLDSAGLKFQVYDAGVCGSDPFYEYTLLRYKLLRYHPTHVIVCINNSDVADYIFRGGMERFLPDSTTKFRSGPWWKFLYAHSHLFRLVYNTRHPYNNDGTFVAGEEQKKEKEMAKAAIYNCLVATKALCDANKIKLLVVAHPVPFTFSCDNINDDIYEMDKVYAHAPVHLIDLFDDFALYLNKNNYLQYGWPINAHFNAKGYELYADILFNEVNRQYPDFWQSQF